MGPSPPAPRVRASGSRQEASLEPAGRPAVSRDLPAAQERRHGVAPRDASRVRRPAGLRQGVLVTDRDGRVEIVYKPEPGAKVYRAGARNLSNPSGGPLDFEAVSRTHFRGGSILGTSRANPTKNPAHLAAVVQSLKRLGSLRGLDALRLLSPVQDPPDPGALHPEP